MRLIIKVLNGKDCVMEVGYFVWSVTCIIVISVGDNIVFCGQRL